jgi:hypothetical protein
VGRRDVKFCAEWSPRPSGICFNQCYQRSSEADWNHQPLYTETHASVRRNGEAAMDGAAIKLGNSMSRRNSEGHMQPRIEKME